MTPDDLLRALRPGIAEYFKTRGFSSIVSHDGVTLVIRLASEVGTYEKTFPFPRSNRELRLQLDEWVNTIKD